jgi:hypothetical protein
MTMPKETYGIGIFLAAVAAGLLLAAYAGPYRFVADLQIALFSTNIVVISYFVTMLMIAAPIMGLVYALERRFGTRVTWFTPIWSNLDKVFDLPPGKLLLVGMTLVVMGGYFYVKDLGAGPLVPLSVRDLETGRPPPGNYVTLTDGTLMNDTSITFKDGSSVRRYIPVVDHAAQPMLFLRVSDRQPARDLKGNITGILEPNGMEGELQSQLQSVHAIGEKYYVIGVGREPNTAVGGWMGLIGAGLSLIGLIWWRESYPMVRKKAETGEA